MVGTRTKVAASDEFFCTQNPPALFSVLLFGLSFYYSSNLEASCYDLEILSSNIDLAIIFLCATVVTPFISLFSVLSYI